MSETAAGQIKGRLVFSLRTSGQQSRIQKAQKDRQTTSQIDQRNLYIEAVAAWNNLSPEEREIYKQTAAGFDLTGYNLYIQEYLIANAGGPTKAIYAQGIYGLAIYGNI